MFSHLLVSALSLMLLSTTPVYALWPIPTNYTSGSTALFLSQNIAITYNGQPLNFVFGYQPSDLSSKQIVWGGISRTLQSIFSAAFVPWMLHPRNQLSSFEPDVSKNQTWVKSLAITTSVNDTNATYQSLGYDTDESYNLTISSTGAGTLSAATAIGVLRGLETFSQLFYQHSSGSFWYTPYAPVSIQDKPKFQHRGVAIDVARNFYPVKNILSVIDGMAYNKLNKLHIHVTDSQSWPLEIPNLPSLAKLGAYRPDFIYSVEDIEQIQKYGIQRGVEVYFEIDMPGHIGSVSWAYPELIVAFDEQPYWWYCGEPPCGAFKLNETRVQDFLETLFDDLLPRVKKYGAFFHTGGDELNANDSSIDPGVGTNETAVLQPLVQKFINQTHDKVRKNGMTPMVWEEIITTWNVSMPNDTIVQTWLGSASVKSVASQGYRVIDSDYSYWYLDCGRGQWLGFENGAAYQTYYPFTDWCQPYKAWQLVYSHDPTAGLTTEEAGRVLGGEVAIWSETIDPVSLETLLWPRGSAFAEAVWSGRTDASGTNRSLIEAAPRLDEQRNLLVARGINASPIQMTWCSQANATDCTYQL